MSVPHRRDVSTAAWPSFRSALEDLESLNVPDVRGPLQGLDKHCFVGPSTRAKSSSCMDTPVTTVREAFCREMSKLVC